MFRTRILGALLPVLGLLAAGSAGADPLRDLTDQVRQSRERVTHHLVQIIRQRDPGSTTRFLGTGVALGGGKFLTSASLVGPQDMVTLVTVEGDSAVARVVGVDRRTNVALVESPVLMDPMPVSEDPLLFPGDLVVAVGLGPPGVPAASFGTVVLFEGPPLGFTEIEAVQASAPAFPGFTGGALCDLEGRMVGFITGRTAFDPATAILPAGADLISGTLVGDRLATTSAGAATVALPVGPALEIANHLGESGQVPRGYLGLSVELQRVRPSPGARMRGVMVHNVVSEGPAARIGIIPGDVILEYEGIRVRSPDNLSFLVSATVPGSQVSIRFLRRGRRLASTITIEQAPELPWMPTMDQALSMSDGRVAPTVR